MSVVAMAMDDQRPLMSANYDKMSKQFEHSMHVGAGGGAGSGGTGGVGSSGGGGVVGSSGNVGVGGSGGGGIAAPPSGPASPTPSGSEEPPPSSSSTNQYHHAAHHHHIHHHHHHRHSHQVQQHLSVAPEQQQQQQQTSPSPPPSSTSTNAALPTQQSQLQQTQQQQLPAVAEAVAAAEQRQRLLEEEIESLKVEQTRLSLQCADAQRREKILMRRLANKEQEFQDYVSQIAEYKAAQAPTALALRSALLDPAVNLLFEKLKKELKATKAKLEETQNELSAWKFTPDSNTGKRLMAKCRLLYQENEELGKMTSNGRLAKLETELAMQKSFSEEVKKSQSEFDDYLQELDEDVEGMQSTILFLQQELKTTRDRIQHLEKENYQLKNGVTGGGSDGSKNIEDDNSQPSSRHTDFNGISHNAVDQSSSASLYNSNIPPQQNEMKFRPSMPLETIDENICLRSGHTNASELYNGTDEKIPPTPVMQQMTGGVGAVVGIGGGDVDAGSNSNNFSGVTGGGGVGGACVLRTVASRKRNYDSDSNETTGTTVNTPTSATTVMSYVNAPRTLPPKKSKLRRSSVQSVEMNDYENTATGVAITGGVVGVGAGLGIGVGAGAGAITGGSGIVVPPTEAALGIVDNAVAGMANEETPTNLVVDESNDNGNTGSVSASGGGVAQRIMTRRRSVRTQQNGSSGNGGGGGSGDSNH